MLIKLDILKCKLKLTLMIKRNFMVNKSLQQTLRGGAE